MDGGERMMEPALAGAPASALPVLAVLREWGWAVEEVESPEHTTAETNRLGNKQFINQESGGPEIGPR